MALYFFLISRNCQFLENLYAQRMKRLSARQPSSSLSLGPQASSGTFRSSSSILRGSIFSTRHQSTTTTSRILQWKRSTTIAFRLPKRSTLTGLGRRYSNTSVRITHSGPEGEPQIMNKFNGEPRYPFLYFIVRPALFCFGVGAAALAAADWCRKHFTTWKQSNYPILNMCKVFNKILFC